MDEQPSGLLTVVLAALGGGGLWAALQAVIAHYSNRSKVAADTEKVVSEGVHVQVTGALSIAGMTKELAEQLMAERDKLTQRLDAQQVAIEKLQDEVNELRTENRELKAENARLMAENAKLSKRVQALEGKKAPAA